MRPLDRRLLEETGIDRAVGLLELLLPELIEARAEILLADFLVADLGYEIVCLRDEIGFDTEKRR